MGMQREVVHLVRKLYCKQLRPTLLCFWVSCNNTSMHSFVELVQVLLKVITVSVYWIDPKFHSILRVFTKNDPIVKGAIYASAIHTLILFSREDNTIASWAIYALTLFCLLVQFSQKFFFTLCLKLPIKELVLKRKLSFW